MTKAHIFHTSIWIILYVREVGGSNPH